jgi:hypothetical protein
MSSSISLPDAAVARSHLCALPPASKSINLRSVTLANPVNTYLLDTSLQVPSSTLISSSQLQEPQDISNLNLTISWVILDLVWGSRSLLALRCVLDFRLGWPRSHCLRQIADTRARPLSRPSSWHQVGIIPSRIACPLRQTVHSLSRTAIQRRRRENWMSMCIT